MLPLPWNFFVAVLMSCYAWAGEVGWGMLPLPWNFFLAVLMSRYAWAGVGWGMLPLPWNFKRRTKCDNMARTSMIQALGACQPRLAHSAQTRTGKASKCGYPIKQGASRKWLAFPKSTHAWCCSATNGAGAAAQVTQSRTSLSKNWQSSLAMRTSE